MAEVRCNMCPTYGEWHFQHENYCRMVTLYTRDDLVRAIVGQQWAVAIAAHNPMGWFIDAPWVDDDHRNRRFGDLPSAVDIISDLYGDQ